MTSSIHKELLQITNAIFFKGSTTYSFSSLFFSRDKFKWISLFYAFVRVIDNLVDERPVQSEAFYQFKKDYILSQNGKKSTLALISGICALQKRFGIDASYILSFLDSMEFDLQPSFVISSIEKCITYMYGSAEIIGIIMSKIIGVPPESFAYARLIGRSMQYVNFLRDIREDYAIGRVYIPNSHAYIKKLDKEYSACYPKYPEYDEFVRNELMRSLGWLYEGLYGFCYMPRSYAIPILTATMMYHRIAQEVFKSPTISYYKPKFRPKKIEVLLKGFQTILTYQESRFDIHSLKRKFIFTLD